MYSKPTLKGVGFFCTIQIKDFLKFYLSLMRGLEDLEIHFIKCSYTQFGIIEVLGVISFPLKTSKTNLGSFPELSQINER